MRVVSLFAHVSIDKKNNSPSFFINYFKLIIKTPRYMSNTKGETIKFPYNENQKINNRLNRSWFIPRLPQIKHNKKTLNALNSPGKMPFRGTLFLGALSRFF